MSIYAVNGKEPIAAWIPSLDTAGNGTTTLTDLVGSNDGTLTNMDAATDWVSDTSNGGVRALDFDGVNDYVSCGDPATTKLNGDVSVSVWVHPRSLNRLAIIGHAASANAFWLLLFSFGSNQKFSFWNSASGPAVTAPNTSPLNQWSHFVAVRSSSGVEIYIDGASVATAAGASGNGSAGTELTIGRFGSFNSYKSSSKIDDIRIFNTALDATDIAYLYNSGNGRGIVASGVVPSRRRRYAGGYGL